MHILQAGTIQTMAVLRKIETGYVLEKEGEQALLHHNETDQQLGVYQQVDVFLYIDKKGQLTATTKLPEIQLDTYGWAEVAETVPNLGVFVSIGIDKEILVSKDDLPLFESVWPEKGDKLYVTLGKDHKNRLLALPAGESAFDPIFEYAPDELDKQPFSGRVYHTSKEGTAIISEEGYRGFIHHTERKEEPRLGEFVTGRVIDLKDDGSVNVSLRPLKQFSMSDDAQAIIEHLHANNGVIPFSDKSDPDDIRGTFHISKAAFKRALGKLLKERLVEQRDGKTYLTNKNTAAE